MKLSGCAWWGGIAVGLLLVVLPDGVTQIPGLLILGTLLGTELVL